MNALNEFGAVMYALEQAGLLNNVNIDFSIVSNMKYYSGIVFNGYINGIPQAVLSGGQYDKLAAKMGKNSGAIGFAVYLDMLEYYGDDNEEYDVDVILLKTPKATPNKLLKAVEILSADGSRVIVLGKVPKNFKYRRLISFDDIKEAE